jgi:ParB-like chromosome segregation protein Spo0J
MAKEFDVIDVRMLEPGRIAMLPELGAGVEAREVARREMMARRCGPMDSVVVGKDGDRFILLEGAARLRAMEGAGCAAVPAVVLGVSGKAELLKAALILSIGRGEGRALSEGMLIESLMSAHGVSCKALSDETGKTERWISKRRSLAAGLCGEAKELVESGRLSPRAAEDVALLPAGRQAEFARKAAAEGMPRSDVALLVRFFRDSEASKGLREAALSDPAGMIGSLKGAGGSAGRRAAGGKGGVAQDIWFATWLMESISSRLEALGGAVVERLAAMLAKLADSSGFLRGWSRGGVMAPGRPAAEGGAAY